MPLYTTPNAYPISMSPTPTMVYCYTWQTHPLPIWSHGYQGDTLLLQSTNTPVSKHLLVILASCLTQISSSPTSPTFSPYHHPFKRVHKYPHIKTYNLTRVLTPSNHDQLLPLPDDTPYLRRSVRNLRFHQPVDVRVLKVSSGISVKRSLLLNEKKQLVRSSAK
jgi:hypothetical protein